MIIAKILENKNLLYQTSRKMSSEANSAPFFSEQGKQALLDKLPTIVFTSLISVIGYMAHRIHSMDKEISKQSERFTQDISSMNIKISEQSERFAHEISAVNTKIAEQGAEVKTKIAEQGTEMKTKIAEVQTQLFTQSRLIEDLTKAIQTNSQSKGWLRIFR